MGRDREALIRLADEALYRSKQGGRDTCSLGDPQLPGLAGRRERDQGAVVDITQVARS
jgi:GGDEF domain-containing protein